MISTFFDHELKAFWRSKNTGKSIAVKVVMGLLLLYLFVCVLLIGLFLDKVLMATPPNVDVIVKFCGTILIYFLADLLMRLQLQELPTLKVQPYLHLSVKRNTVVGYLALTAMLSFFNLWPIVIFGPFIIKVILPAHGAVTALVFLFSVIALSVFNNYLALYIKRKANINGWIFLIAGVVLGLLLCGDFVWHLYSLRSASYFFFGNLIGKPYLVLIPLILAGAMFYLNFYYLKDNLYLEELGSKKVSAYKSSSEIPLLNRYGHIGDLVANEIKLILRNKRPRSALIMGLFLMLYGLIFYTNPQYSVGMKNAFAVFAGMFMTGIFIINYGQFMYSWQASHFDGILVSKVKFTDFLRAKFFLFTVVSTVAFLLTIPYIYFGWQIVLTHFVMYLWNLGVNTTIVLYFANRNYKRIDLSKGASFNWEGVGSTQLLLSIPLLILPFAIYLPFKFVNYPNVGLAVMAILGVVFVLTREFWIKKLEEDFYKKRYKIAEGFRNK
ncbi:hypothetical protein EWM62_15200 [Mucilaginibacter terrigena]|uniref:Uncharacterized protein n=1 Tax=Mucilaginibacter terrigena TaxID=2492395 RepID=A0A4Q5LJR5_9SPHI|nr:DUF5687 family protein [Mucilaginibacter terrigena]RYU87842.1 hypothetical protein EWM62_15200 [Mucilaginibacter terrigena]